MLPSLLWSALATLECAYVDEGSGRDGGNKIEILATLSARLEMIAIEWPRG